MKIVVAVNHYHPSVGGAELVAKTITEHLAKEHEVFVITRRLAQKRDPRDYDYPVLEYRAPDIVGFEAQLKKINPDIVLIYSDVFDFFRQVTCRRQPYKLVLALCGANWLYSHRNHVNLLYRQANNIQALICHSKRERDYRLCNCDRLIEKTVIIPNGVWREEFDQNHLTRQDLAPDIVQKRWILNVSNFFPGKGQQHLVKVMESLPEPDQLAYIQVSSDIDFAIGKQLEGVWRSSIPKIKEKGIAVKLMKNIDREQVIGFFKQSNVFAFTSEKEVAPVVLLESMAASLPWIASNVGNAEDLQGGICFSSMKDSRYHSVFDRRAHHQLVQGIQELWNSPSYGEQGRKQIDDELCWEKILPQYSAVIEG
jgi:glycosyltransferase involved in cell wall biosynthesis